MTAVFSFTGPSRALTDAERDYIVRCLSRYASGGTHYVTGGAEGVDTFVHFAAWLLFPDAKHIVEAPDAPWSGKVAPGAEVRINKPGKTRGAAYMNRNQTLADWATFTDWENGAGGLIAFPETEDEVLRSGEWATIRRARKNGAPYYVFPLDRA